MTTVAWDGKTLAVDRQGTTGGDRAYATTKLRRISDGRVAAFSGAIENGLLLCEWADAGTIKDNWPSCQKSDDFCTLIVAGPDGVFQYESLPIAQRIEGDQMAWGSGAKYALGAMAHGADAVQAVEIAARFDVYTGMGVNCEYVGMK
jgi:hypothetical protein